MATTTTTATTRTSLAPAAFRPRQRRRRRHSEVVRTPGIARRFCRSSSSSSSDEETGDDDDEKKKKRKWNEDRASRRTVLLTSSSSLSMALCATSFAAAVSGGGDARAFSLGGSDGAFDRLGSNAFSSSSSSSSSLESKIANPKLFKKQVINKSRPGATKYPLFLLGEWEEEVSFAGYEFPSDEYIDRKTLERAATCPGFQKLSVAYLPDVGKTPAPKYRARFVHEKPGENVDDASGEIVEDRAFNLRNIFNAYLEDETAVESVDYDFSKNPNRATVTLRRGAANNAERVELFTNARESETSSIDGCSFLCAETLRQVSLGYSVDFNTARVVNYDYEHVWRYQPMKDDKITPFDVTKGDSLEDIRRCNFVKAQLYTIGYLQSDDAMRATARVNQAGTAPIPSLFDAGTAAYAPAVVYSHDVFMERVGCVP